MRQVRVSSGVMASNLVESSVPDYPKLARLTGLQGPVVLEVVISDRGTVDHVDVVKGHHLLRAAAESAVKHWRYRPYLLDGRPVEVATTVTVDFKLDR
jgi:protein TonB